MKSIHLARSKILDRSFCKAMNPHVVITPLMASSSIPPIHLPAPVFLFELLRLSLLYLLGELCGPPLEEPLLPLQRPYLPDDTTMKNVSV